MFCPQGHQVTLSHTTQAPPDGPCPASGLLQPQMAAASVLVHSLRNMLHALQRFP
jgi:hypothetical protein